MSSAESARPPRPRRKRRRRAPSPRKLTFKFRVSREEHEVIRERARGYSSTAEYARRTLVAGWSLPVHNIVRVTDAFIPIQEMIERTRACGFPAEADAATEALREILSVVSER
jgi:hypothetical protein